MNEHPEKKMTKSERRKLNRDIAFVNQSDNDKFMTGINTKYRCSVCGDWQTFGKFRKSPPDRLVCNTCVWKSGNANKV